MRQVGRQAKVGVAQGGIVKCGKSEGRLGQGRLVEIARRELFPVFVPAAPAGTARRLGEAKGARSRAWYGLPRMVWRRPVAYSSAP